MKRPKLDVEESIDALKKGISELSKGEKAELWGLIKEKVRYTQDFMDWITNSSEYTAELLAASKLLYENGFTGIAHSLLIFAVEEQGAKELMISKSKGAGSGARGVFLDHTKKLKKAMAPLKGSKSEAATLDNVKRLGLHSLRIENGKLYSTPLQVSKKLSEEVFIQIVPTYEKLITNNRSLRDTVIDDLKEIEAILTS